MTKHRIVVQWLGNSDLRAMAASLAPEVRTEVLRKIKGELPKVGDNGPIKTLLDSQPFEEVRVLSDHASLWNKLYQEWLARDVNLTSVKLDNPTNYKAIFSAADAELSAIRKRPDWDNIELCLHLSPGTPAMTAVWLLLGKTRYPATFYETYGGRSWITEIPFDLTIDVLPELLKDPDRYLQHLSSESPAEIEGFQDIVGDTYAIRNAVGIAKRAAAREMPVLLLGESGTGKELFANAIHAASPRSGRPFVATNCAALTATLLESELFGHVRGAFTGANADRKGVFEEADGGTLFLDEVGECDPEIQAKLLRVLEPLAGEGDCIRSIRRLGDSRDRRVDVRIIAATNKDLAAAISTRSFRDDLYHRLAGMEIVLPPLRDRRADIPRIAEKLLERINDREPTGSHKSLSESAIAFVKRLDWPGNVRQLYNVLRRSVALADGDLLERRDISAALADGPGEDRVAEAISQHPLGEGFELEEFLNNVQRAYLRRAMEEAKGVKAEAARLLGIASYQTLTAQLRRLGVSGDWDE